MPCFLRCYAGVLPVCPVKLWRSHGSYTFLLCLWVAWTQLFRGSPLAQSGSIPRPMWRTLRSSYMSNPSFSCALSCWYLSLFLAPSNHKSLYALLKRTPYLSSCVLVPACLRCLAGPPLGALPILHSLSACSNPSSGYFVHSSRSSGGSPNFAFTVSAHHNYFVCCNVSCSIHIGDTNVIHNLSCITAASSVPITAPGGAFRGVMTLLRHQSGSRPCLCFVAMRTWPLKSAAIGIPCLPAQSSNLLRPP